MNTPSTRGQLERTLNQQIQALYREFMGHSPKNVSCNLADTKITIVLEDSLTPAESRLMESGQVELASQVRDNLDEGLKPQLKTLIEKVTGVAVIDLISGATLETGLTGVIAVLSEAPLLRATS
ncbi:MAG: DUF2294 domain-containing protein [Anaerolineae bacterium]|nr:DUF2294 domain-containing protein [Gloeobacterales cyanobacterium ES-bin-313]